MYWVQQTYFRNRLANPLDDVLSVVAGDTLRQVVDESVLQCPATYRNTEDRSQITEEAESGGGDGLFSLGADCKSRHQSGWHSEALTEA